MSDSDLLNILQLFCKIIYTLKLWTAARAYAGICMATLQYLVFTASLKDRHRSAVFYWQRNWYSEIKASIKT